MRSVVARRRITDFSAMVEAVARELVAVNHDTGHSFISTPLMYPNGTSVVVRIEDARDEYFVTDFGMGYEEATMMGASNMYSRSAKAIADAARVGFDRHSFFAIRVTREQLAGAIVTVANCSKEAVNIVAYKLADRKSEDAIEMLYSRLVAVFPKRIIARDISVIGHSNTEWHVATMVKAEGRPTIFEPVSAHHVSIFAASTKFQDIAEVDDAPSRVAVVEKKADLKTYLAVLSRSASVIERESSNDTYSQLANAA